MYQLIWELKVKFRNVKNLKSFTIRKANRAVIQPSPEYPGTDVLENGDGIGFTRLHRRVVVRKKLITSL